MAENSPANPDFSVEVELSGDPCGPERTLYKKVGYWTERMPSAFLLEFDKRACLMKCDTEFESCMSGAKGDPSGEFRCGEKRWACTRGCDAQTNKPFLF